MSKRRRSTKSSNPLSDARKGIAFGSYTVKGEAFTDNVSQQIQKKTDDLWHRKSGAGYNLFMKYYGNQPSGIVANAADFEASSELYSATTTQISQDKARVGAGMSRASKKRQKKKAKMSGVNDIGGVNSLNVATDGTKCGNDTIVEVEKVLTKLDSTPSHPLIQALGLQPSYKHLASYVHTLATPLPLTLRLRKNVKTNILEEHYAQVAPVHYDPFKRIYQSKTLTKSTLGSTPVLKELIITASMDGTLARQEIGSMLPVIALHSTEAIKKGSKVLDLCASPGSKTLQALEIVAQNGKGRIIANDVHSGRLDSLREAVVRSGLSDTLTTRVTFTNYDASIFPLPRSGKLFDAIICDVPCSGDGTIRKDKHILPLWTPNTGNELHGLQVKILSRALELVKIGGIVCYSTCSLNPVEDEAVVAAALLETKSEMMKFELMTWPKNLLSGFIRRPGIRDWNVGFYDHNKIDGGSDDYGSIIFCADKHQAEDAGIKDVSATLWPPKPQIQQLNIERCVRLLPQDNDTGGFFLVLIKRLK